MSEEVKIVVKQEAQGNAIAETQAKIQQLQAKIADLNRLEKSYTEKGLPSAAASTRSERIPYARELRDLSREQRTAEKAAAAEKATAQQEEAKHQQQITREHREQAAIGKARESRLQRLGNAAANFAESQAGAGGFGGVTSALGAIGGPTGTAAAIAAAVATAVLASEARRADTFKIGELSAQEARAKDRISLRRLAGPDGSAGGARDVAIEARAEAQEREEAKKRLEEESRPKWYKNPGLWVNNLFGAGMKTTEGEAAERENAAAQSRAVARAHEADEIKKKKFAELNAPLIEAQERMTRGDGRGARKLEDEVKWRKEYNAAIKDGAEAWQAQESASANYDATMKARSGKYAGLISARDGVADTARVAAAAANERGIKIEGFHELSSTMRDSAETAGRRRFSRPAWGRAGES